MAHKNNKKQKDEETPVCADCRRVAVLEPGALYAAPDSLTKLTNYAKINL